jgi:uncharacterized protein
LIVADTSAMIALLDADSAEHEALLSWYEADPDQWLLPWATLPEIDYLLAHRVHADAQLAFLRDVAESRFAVEWGDQRDLLRALELSERYQFLQLGMVDAVVMAVAERHRADAIATLDLRHFGVVRLHTEPLLIPRDG